MHLPFLISLLPTFVRGESLSQVPFPFDPGYNSTPPILSVTQLQWAELNASVSGRLIAGEPFAKPCFARYKGADVPVDDALCTTVRNAYRSELIRTSIPASQINTQWETCQAHAQGCLLDFTDPQDPEASRPPRECYLGSVSNYYINAHSPDDVRAALAFARTTRVPLVIKNTGHDYKGRSSAPHSLGLWMHNFREMEYHPAFTPTCLHSADSGSIHAESAITLGAGVRWFEAYSFAEEHNVTLVGGADRSVGAVGGWLQGGGHGALSNTLGMGADRVLEFHVVTPDGETRIANQCQNQDIFFALRGGGGGTFGVVLKATIRAAPRLTIQAVMVTFPSGARLTDPSGDNDELDDLEVTRSLWTLLVQQGPRWAREGWGAYITACSALYLNPVLGRDDAQESMNVLVKWGEDVRATLRARGAEGNASVEIVQGQYDSWGHFFNLFADGHSAHLGEPLAIASRLIPETLFETEESRQALVDALVAAEREAPGVRLLKTTPYNYPGQHVAADGDGYTGPALHPAWRTSIFHVTAITTWNWNSTRSEIVGRYETASRAIGHLRRAIGEGVDGGVKGAAYVNEADVKEADYEETFWGGHYPRLLEIKNKYDPDRLLDCWQCVGWDPLGPRFSCYL